ncbi:hypothetical protein TB1_012612 [Malus domestica]
MRAFSTLLKLKDSDKFDWKDEHQAAFTQIKVSLTTPPVLVPPRRGKPLKLYISAVEESIGCLFAQDNDAGREQVITNQRSIILPSRSFASLYFLPHQNLGITCYRRSPRLLPRLTSSATCSLGQ